MFGRGETRRGCLCRRTVTSFEKNKQTNPPILPSNHNEEPSPGSYLHFPEDDVVGRDWDRLCLWLSLMQPVWSQTTSLYHLQPGHQKRWFFIHLYWSSFLVRDFCKSDKQLTATRRHTIRIKAVAIEIQPPKTASSKWQFGIKFYNRSGRLANVSALPDFLFLALTGVQDSAIRLQSVWDSACYMTVGSLQHTDLL